MTREPVTSDDERRAIYQAIGHVAVQSALLERSMRCLYAAMVGSPRADLLAAGQSFGALRTACLEMNKDDPWMPNSDVFDRVLTVATELMEERNEVIHGEWYKVNDTPDPLVIRSRYWRTVRKGTLRSIDNVEVLARRISAVAGHIESITARRDPSGDHERSL